MVRTSTGVDDVARTPKDGGVGACGVANGGPVATADIDVIPDTTRDGVAWCAAGGASAGAGGWGAMSRARADMGVGAGMLLLVPGAEGAS